MRRTRDRHHDTFDKSREDLEAEKEPRARSRRRRVAIPPQFSAARSRFQVATHAKDMDAPEPFSGTPAPFSLNDLEAIIRALPTCSGPASTFPRDGTVYVTTIVHGEDNYVAYINWLDAAVKQMPTLLAIAQAALAEDRLWGDGSAPDERARRLHDVLKRVRE